MENKLSLDILKIVGINTQQSQNDVQKLQRKKIKMYFQSTGSETWIKWTNLATKSWSNETLSNGSYWSGTKPCFFPYFVNKCIKEDHIQNGWEKNYYSYNFLEVNKFENSSELYASNFAKKIATKLSEKKTGIKSR